MVEMAHSVFHKREKSPLQSLDKKALQSRPGVVLAQEGVNDDGHMVCKIPPVAKNAS